jgi:hypothetical protein
MRESTGRRLTMGKSKKRQKDMVIHAVHPGDKQDIDDSDGVRIERHAVGIDGAVFNIYAEAEDNNTVIILCADEEQAKELAAILRQTAGIVVA